MEWWVVRLAKAEPKLIVSAVPQSNGPASSQPTSLLEATDRLMTFYRTAPSQTSLGRHAMAALKAYHQRLSPFLRKPRPPPVNSSDIGSLPTARRPSGSKSAMSLRSDSLLSCRRSPIGNKCLCTGGACSFADATRPIGTNVSCSLQRGDMRADVSHYDDRARM